MTMIFKWLIYRPLILFAAVCLHLRAANKVARRMAAEAARGGRRGSEVRGPENRAEGGREGGREGRRGRSSGGGRGSGGGRLDLEMIALSLSLDIGAIDDGNDDNDNDDDDDGDGAAVCTTDERMMVPLSPSSPTTFNLEMIDIKPIKATNEALGEAVSEEKKTDGATRTSKRRGVYRLFRGEWCHTYVAAKGDSEGGRGTNNTLCAVCCVLCAVCCVLCAVCCVLCGTYMLIPLGTCMSNESTGGEYWWYH